MGLLAVALAAFVAARTSILAGLSGLVRQTFSPGGIMLAEMPLAVSTKTAALPAGVSAKPETVASKSSPTVPSPVVVASSVSPLPPAAQPSAVSGRVLVSEIMVGSEGNAKDEFIELYNPTDRTIDLTGYSIRKKSSTGTESSLVAAARLNGKSIAPGGYFLLGSGGGYAGPTLADVLWPASYSLSAKNNAIVLYDGSGGTEEVAWQEIPAGGSLVRMSWSDVDFRITSTPTPQASQGL